MHTTFDDSLYEDFNINKDGMKALGRGAYGIVFLVHGKDGVDYALKVQNYDNFKEYEWTMSQMIRGKSPYLVQLYQQLVIEDDIFIKMEFANMTTLTKILKTEHTHSGMKKGTIDLMFQILSGVQVLHKNGLIHRDLKSDNIMLHLNEKGRIVCKITDYGLIRPFDVETDPDDDSQSGCAPTPLIMAPEVLDAECGVEGARYNRKADMWSVGIIFYELVTNGRHPLEGAQSVEDLVTMIKNPITRPDALTTPTSSAAALGNSSPALGNPSHASKASTSGDNTNWTPTDPEVLDACWDLIKNLLAYDPKNRPSAIEAMRHPIFNMCGPPEAVAFLENGEEDTSSLPDVVPVPFRNSPSSAYSSAHIKITPDKLALIRDEFLRVEEEDVVRTAKRITPNRMALLRGLFKTFDIDNSNSLDLEEVKLCLLHTGVSLTDESIMNLVEISDTNRSGVIEFSEFLRMYELAWNWNTPSSSASSETAAASPPSTSSQTSPPSSSSSSSSSSTESETGASSLMPTVSSSSSLSSSASMPVLRTLSDLKKQQQQQQQPPRMVSLQVTPEMLAIMHTELRKCDVDSSGSVNVKQAQDCLSNVGIDVSEEEMGILSRTFDFSGHIEFTKFMNVYSDTLKEKPSSSFSPPPRTLAHSASAASQVNMKKSSSEFSLHGTLGATAGSSGSTSKRFFKGPAFWMKK